MTLRAQITSDVHNVLLEADDFAETVTYYPAGGGASRSVVAIVEELGSIVDENTGIASRENISVTVSRDVDAVADDGTTLNGIDDPKLGDGLVRSGDDASKGYSYTGDKENVDDAAWQLIFTRHVIIRHGGNHQPR